VFVSVNVNGTAASNRCTFFNLDGKKTWEKITDKDDETEC